MWRVDEEVVVEWVGIEHKEAEIKYGYVYLGSYDVNKLRLL